MWENIESLVSWVMLFAIGFGMVILYLFLPGLIIAAGGYRAVVALRRVKISKFFPPPFLNLFRGEHASRMVMAPFIVSGAIGLIQRLAFPFPESPQVAFGCFFLLIAGSLSALPGSRRLALVIALGGSSGLWLGALLKLLATLPLDVAVATSRLLRTLLFFALS